MRRCWPPGSARWARWSTGGWPGLRTADSWLVAAAAAALPLVAWQVPARLGHVFAAALLAVALVPVLGGDTAGGARRAAAGVFGTAWLAALTGLVLLGEAALPLIFAVSVADVGAWCAGRLGGGPALSPLSPAKRWTGRPAVRWPGSRRWPRARTGRQRRVHPRARDRGRRRRAAR